MPQILSSIVRHTARVSALLIAGVFVAFVLGEPLASLGNLQPREWVGMILLFATFVAMLVAWKWEFSAALISLLALAAFAILFHMTRYDVLGVIAAPNVLYLLDWMLRHVHLSHSAKAA